MTEGDINKLRSDLVVPMDFEIEDRPLEQIEKASKAGFHITKDVRGKIKVIGRTVIKGDKKDDLEVSK